MSLSLSLTSPIGAVFWGLVAIAIAAIARLYRRKLTPMLRHMLIRFPRWLVPPLRRITYLLYPTWRSFAQGSERIRDEVDARIGQLRIGPRMPVILVGGIYLDVWLSPVSVRLAKNTEYSDLDTVRAEPGGSAFYVGKYLGESFNRRSYLFSRIGRGDPFSRHLERIVKDVPWIRGDHLTASGTSQCGVSVHLIDHDGTFLPTFTHRGSLVELSWPLILRDLQHYTRRGGGLLYISGLFRTGLAVDLVSSIQKLSPGVLVVLDHGRFQPDDHVAAVRSLLDAFRLAAIDIYICTYSEIAALARGAGVVVSGEVSQFELIESFAGMHFLPKITVVRGDPEPGQPVAILAIDDKIELIEDGPHNWVPRNIPGGNSAFTAGFLNHFYRESPQGNLQDYLENAVRAGLRFWATRG